jgi:glycyl-tRNA synthetase beta chain
VDLDIVELVNHSADTYAAAGNPVGTNAKKQCIAFVMERYRALYAALGFAQDEISAVLEAGANRPLDFDRRLKALAKFRHRRDAASLAAANKRIRNILRKSEQSITKELKPQLLTESAEIALSQAILETAGAIAPVIARADYPAALRILAGLRPVVDRFFDEVMVMAEDLPLRANRLTLLDQLSDLFLTIADISLLQTPERPSGR